MDDKQLKAIEERTNRYCTTIEDYKQAEQDRDALLSEVKRLQERADRLEKTLREYDIMCVSDFAYRKKNRKQYEAVLKEFQDKESSEA